MASSPEGGTSSVTDVLDRAMGLSREKNQHGILRGPNTNEPVVPSFIASNEFRGSKNGYVYRTSLEFGTGYHLDDDNNNNNNNTGHEVVRSSTSSTAPTKRARFDASRDIIHAIPARRPIQHSSHTDDDDDVDVDEDTKTTTATTSTTTTTSGEELLAQAEANYYSSNNNNNNNNTSFSTKILELTPRGIQLASSSLEKIQHRNSLLRAQYGKNDPEKYMYEELALHDEIMNFSSAAVNVSLYTSIVENNVISNSFMELLNHDNVDVALCVVNVMMELLDPTLLNSSSSSSIEVEEDAMKRNRSNMALLANTFLDNGGMELLSSNLGRLDKSIEEEAKGIDDILTLVESLLDLDRMGVLSYEDSVLLPLASSSSQEGAIQHHHSHSLSIIPNICEQTTFVSWLFQQIHDDDNNNDDHASSSSSLSPALLRLHVTEVLSTILQHEEYSMKKMGGKLTTLIQYTSIFHEMEEENKMMIPKDVTRTTTTTIDGMEILLQAIAKYRKSDPATEVECEFLENIFDALAASLMSYTNDARNNDNNNALLDFIHAEGIELMLRCLRQNGHAGGGALRVLNFALSGSLVTPSRNVGENTQDVNKEGTNDVGTNTRSILNLKDEDDEACANNVYRMACETFIQAGGLKILFPIYMGRKTAIPCPAACSDGGSDLAKRGILTGSSKRAKRAAQARKQWLVEVEKNTIHIVYALTRHIAKDSKYDAHARLLVKFLEEDCEKCDRTIELCLKYDEKARIAEYQYFRSDEAYEAEQMGMNIETTALGAKLRGGGDIFHRACAILSFACVGSKRCHAHSLEQMKLQGSGISVIKDGLSEFATLLSDGRQKSQIEQYITLI